LILLRECMSTRYVLFWIVVVTARDPKDLFVEHVTIFYHTITGLIWVGLVK
jgi:hypothetical protein